METIKIIKDPVYPDLENWDEEEWKKKTKEFGFIDIDFLLEDGVEISYDLGKIYPGKIISGHQVFNRTGSPYPLVMFVFGSDLCSIDLVYYGTREIIASIPIENIIDLYV